jgi:hypothetical protein
MFDVLLDSFQVNQGAGQSGAVNPIVVELSRFCSAGLCAAACRHETGMTVIKL